jgi:membrane associated rhomboid family serine protease
MDERTLPPPPPTAAGPEVCYRHPDVPTGVHCTRCGRPICPDCMHPAPVGHHCPTCVAEARREFRRSPGRRVGGVVGTSAVSYTTLVLLAIAGAFALEVAAGGPTMITQPDPRELIGLGAAVPALIADGQWWRLLTSMLLHAGILHLGLNAWGLYLFGAVVERQAYGRARFLTFFLIAGIVGGVASYVMRSPTDIRELVAPGVGASGGIFGLVGAVAVYAYIRRDTPIGRVYLRWAVMIVVLNLLIGGSTAGIDNVAHIGGALGGAACAAAAELGRRRGRVLEIAGYAGIVAASIAVMLAQSAAIIASPRFEETVRFLRQLPGPF